MINTSTYIMKYSFVYHFFTKKRAVDSILDEYLLCTRLKL